MTLGLLFAVFVLHGQYLTVDDLAHALTLSKKDRVAYFLDKGFVHTKSSTSSTVILEKYHSGKPTYQQVQISSTKNDIMSVASDGGYYFYFMEKYSRSQYEVTKYDEITIYYDAKKNIDVTLSTTRGTNITHYVIAVSAPD